MKETYCLNCEVDTMNSNLRLLRMKINIFLVDSNCIISGHEKSRVV